MKMIRQLEQARQGLLTREVRSVARKEGLSAETLAEKVAAGQVVLLKHHGQAVGIGAGLRIKVNVNLGTSPDYVDLKLELTKLKTVCRLGADTVMDLSTGGDLKNIRQRILAESQVP
ncbi:MAG TPA: phosphomethylpyrimidine synthase ThiC, partial [bacterium]|nr:phosphomethylpyrimidine synthase ThiC [bacterium]